MSSPKYVALRERVESELIAGLAPGDSVPSERALMATFGVSRATVRRALDLLAADGLVERVQGAGTFVSDPATVSKSLTLTSFTEDIEARGMRPGSRAVTWTRLPATGEVAEDLGLPPGTPVIHVYRLRTADGSPMCLEDVWVPADVLPDHSAVPGSTCQVTSLYAALEELGVIPDTAEQTIRATVLDAIEADQLGVAPQSPAFLVTRLTRDAGGRPVERGRSLYRADRYDFRFTVRRRHRP